MNKAIILVGHSLTKKATPIRSRVQHPVSRVLYRSASTLRLAIVASAIRTGESRGATVTVNYHRALVLFGIQVVLIGGNLQAQVVEALLKFAFRSVDQLRALRNFHALVVLVQLHDLLEAEVANHRENLIRL